MSLLPLLDFPRPSRILDQHFGLGLTPEDLLAPMTIPRELRSLLHHPHHHYSGYLRPWRSAAGQRDLGSTVEVGKDKFQVNLDVQHFTPEEISVKVSGDVITVEGKHEEKEDEHGYISRHFVRKYVLPKGHDIHKIQSKLSSDGVLTIVAPKENQEEVEHRTIPITHTGQPSRTVGEANKKEEKMEA